MKNKIISVITVTVMLLTIISTSMSASALVDNKIKYGDVDGNGVVDIDDARAVLMSASGLKGITESKAFKRADVNNDGFITVYDARQVLRSVSGLVALQPSGAFSGFKGYSDSNFNISSPEAAIAVFNVSLNNVKTKLPGFTRSETAEINELKIEEVKFIGIGFGNTTESVTKLVKDMLVSESEPAETQVVLKGENNYNAMSVEGEDFVSKLTEDEVYGIDVSYSKEGYITIKVALADGEIDNLSQTAYAKAFNPEIIKEKSNGLLTKVFSENTPDDAQRKLVKNAVLTLVMDTAGRVVSYTTTYETDFYIPVANFGVSSILSAELNDLEYGTKITVVYDDFQW